MSITKEYLTELINEPTKDVDWFKRGIELKIVAR